MSKKRVADNYLTHENWDREDQDEEKETAPEPFKPASEEVLAKRSFKKAARRVKPTENKDKVNPFAAFSGFSNSGGFGSKPADKIEPTTNSSAPSGGFNFNSGNGGFSFKPPSSDTDKSTTTPVKPTFSFSFGTKPTATPDKQNDTEEKDNLTKPPVVEKEAVIIYTDDKEVENIEKKDSNENDTVAKNNNSDDEEYLVKLASLNKSLLRWIQKHMDENNCIDLTPVFGDYEKHLKEISS